MYVKYEGKDFVDSECERCGKVTKIKKTFIKPFPKG